MLVRTVLTISLMLGHAAAQTLLEFESRLESVRKTMEDGRWKSASKKLEQVLADNEGMPHAFGRRSEILEMLAQITFGLRHPDPEPSEFVEGDVRSYNERSGEIKIEWTGGYGRDWRRSGAGNMRYFVAPMTGPFTVDYAGKELAGAVQFVLAVDRGNYYSIASGLRDEFRLVASREVDGVLETLKDRNDSPVEKGESYRFRFTARKTSLSLNYNGKKLASVPKKRDHWGLLGVAGSVAQKLTLKGRIDTAWIQNRRSAWREETKKSFEREFDIKQVAPAWLFEPPRIVASTDEAPPGLPWQIDDDLDDFIASLTERIDDGKTVLARKMLDGDDGRDVPEPARIWFHARIEFAEKKWDAVIARLATIEKAFVAARVLKARALLRSGRDAEAVEHVDDLLRDSPDRRDDFGHLAWDLFEVGRIEHADAVLRRARGLGAKGKDIDRLGKLLRYATDGPEWPRRFEVKTRNYHVYSDIDRATCARACDILEKAYDAFTAYVGDVEDSGRRRFRVYLFSGEAGYASYVRDLTGTIAAGSAGLYFPKLKQLLIWNTDADQMLWTIRHEGFHQYFDRICADDSPRWLNEGLAEYYERAGSGTWQKGTPREDHLETLRSRGTVPLKRLAYMGAAAFMMDAGRHYAQSWALVRFLRHSTRENRILFKALVDRLKTAPPGAAMDEVFAGLDWERLEREFREHVASLR